MRIPSHHNRRAALDSETMTPMIDVVFLLLVFFVCASVGQTPDSLMPAELRSGTTQTMVPVAEPDLTEWQSPDVFIRLLAPDASGLAQIQLNERTVAGAAELSSRLSQLAELDRGARIVLDIDDEVPVQQFITVYDLCQTLAFEVISFAVHR